MLALVLAAAACHAGVYADRSCTPGAKFNATAQEVCQPGWSSRHRHVTESTKRKVYARYGIRHHKPYSYEIDHLISLEIGGNNSIRNLWPEKYAGSRGARVKDSDENRLHREVCDGKISLRTAQKRIVAKWSRR